MKRTIEITKFRPKYYFNGTLRFQLGRPSASAACIVGARACGRTFRPSLGHEIPYVPTANWN